MSAAEFTIELLTYPSSELYEREVLPDEIDEDPPQDAIGVVCELNITVSDSDALAADTVGNAVVAALADSFDRSRMCFKPA